MRVLSSGNFCFSLRKGFLVKKIVIFIVLTALVSGISFAVLKIRETGQKRRQKSLWRIFGRQKFK
jgi:uncharacterized protein YqhQ